MTVHELASQYASGDVLVDLSSATNESEENIRTAMSAAIPAVLLILIDKCSMPSGAGVVLEAVDPRGPSMLERLPSAFASGSDHLLIETGYRHLNSVAGRAASDDLVRAISQFAEITHSAAHSVVGIASCVSFATIARDVMPQDAHALAAYLNDEKPAVLRMLPVGMYEHLDEVLTLRPLAHQYDTGSPATATDDAMQDEAFMPRQENVHNERYYKVDQSRGLPQELAWLIPILIVAAIISATVFLLHPRNAEAPKAVTRTPSEDVAMPAAGVVPAAETGVLPLTLASDPSLGKEITSLLDSIATTLAISAPAAQRQKGLSDQLIKLQQLMPRITRLPAADHRAVAEAINRRMPELQTMTSSTMLSEDPTSRQKANEIVRELRSVAQETL